MKQYLDILKNILENGTDKQPVRIENGQVKEVENGTLCTFGENFIFDMSTGKFPLQTIRRVPFKSTCVELEGFIKGITDKQWYQDRKCKYWDYWCSHYNRPEFQSKEEERQYQLENKDLGPLGYSWEWRHFGESYYKEDIYKEDYSVNHGKDQLKEVVEKLHKNPYDRRMIVSGWNPNQMYLSALNTCHVAHNLCVIGDKLNLFMWQRSCDFLVNQTITTYALLMLLYCEEANLKPGILDIKFVDCHIYKNQLESAKELLKREPKELPEVKIKRKNNGEFSIFDWTYEDVELIGYDPHPKLDMGAITV